MKALFTLAILLLLTIAPSRAADVPLEDLAESWLTKASDFPTSFKTGFAAQPSPNNLALLVLLGAKDPAARFKKITAVRGVPALYGVIGLRLCDRSGETYRECFSAVLARDGDLEIETRSYCIVGRDRVKTLMALPETKKESKIIAFGQYAASVFANLDLENDDYVVQNGLLPELLVNPYLRISLAGKEALKGDPDLLEQFDKGARIITDDLIFKNPREILKLLGYADEQSIRECLVKP